MYVVSIGIVGEVIERYKTLASEISRVIFEQILSFRLPIQVHASICAFKFIQLDATTTGPEYLLTCHVKIIYSVNEGYLTYTQFRALQHFSSAALSVLSTQVINL